MAHGRLKHGYCVDKKLHVLPLAPSLELGMILPVSTRFTKKVRGDKKRRKVLITRRTSSLCARTFCFRACAASFIISCIKKATVRAALTSRPKPSEGALQRQPAAPRTWARLAGQRSLLIFALPQTA